MVGYVSRLWDDSSLKDKKRGVDGRSTASSVTHATYLEVAADTTVGPRERMNKFAGRRDNCVFIVETIFLDGGHGNCTPVGTKVNLAMCRNDLSPHVSGYGDLHSTDVECFVHTTTRLVGDVDALEGVVSDSFEDGEAERNGADKGPFFLGGFDEASHTNHCLLYTSPSPRD